MQEMEKVSHEKPRLMKRFVGSNSNEPWALLANNKYFNSKDEEDNYKNYGNPVYNYFY